VFKHRRFQDVAGYGIFQRATRPASAPSVKLVVNIKLVRSGNGLIDEDLENVEAEAPVFVDPDGKITANVVALYQPLSWDDRRKVFRCVILNVVSSSRGS
jgi:hypothetical protein